MGSVGHEARACPEPVTLDPRGQPRNADGHIRQCWPDQAQCHCDGDSDCYAEPGYRPCTPVSPNATGLDAGVTDSGGVSLDVSRSVSDVSAVPRDTGGTVNPVDTAMPSVLPGPDNVSYRGSFAAQTGQSRASLTVLGEGRDVTVYVPTRRAANPPLVLLFHGTNGSGDGVFDESNARTFADSNGVVIAAPSSRWMPRGDWDHRTEETFWQTAPDTNPDTNEDLVLTRAIIVEAQRRWNIDPRRVYAVGHSNGGFFALTVATRLAARVAAFATSSAGLVRCGHTWDCMFQGSGSSCAALASQQGWCRCSGASLPVALPSSGPPLAGYLAHGTNDPLVSVQYTCDLASQLAARNYAVTVALRDGDGHVLPSDFLVRAWAFVATKHR